MKRSDTRTTLLYILEQADKVCPQEEGYMLMQKPQISYLQKWQQGILLGILWLQKVAEDQDV